VVVLDGAHDRLAGFARAELLAAVAVRAVAGLLELRRRVGVDRAG
jgi:hypothetical protein